MNDFAVPGAKPPPTPLLPDQLAHGTDLAVVEIGEALSLLGYPNRLGGVEDPRRARCARRLEMAAQRLRGEPVIVPDERLRLVLRSGTELTTLMIEVLDAWGPSHPEPTKALSALRALLAPLAPEKKGS